jgi:hypothetical protein
MANKKELKLKSYLTLHKPCISPNSLDPNVFYFPETGEPPVLQPRIHSQILNDLEFFCKEQQNRIKKYVLVGDALIPGNQDRTKPLKVLIVLNKDIMDLDIEGMLSEVILKTLNSLSGRLAYGTVRPIVYTPTVRSLDIHKEQYQAIYDIATNAWIKLPKTS